jgi:hypothetical protein
MGGAQVLLEVALVVLLGTTLFHAMRLERALGVLKRDRAVLEELVAGFNDSTRQAEVGVERLRAATDGAGRQIARQIELAQRLRDDLGFLNERGEKIAERLEGAVRSARMAGDQAAFMPGGMPGGMQAGLPAMQGNGGGAAFGAAGGPAGGAMADAESAGGAKLRSEAERDLLRALRAAR